MWYDVGEHIESQDFREGGNLGVHLVNLILSMRKWRPREEE